MFRKNLLFFFCFLSAIFFSQKTQKAVDLKVTDDYTHQWTKTVFPSLWSGFTRVTVRSYDSKNKNMGISYVQQKSKKNKTVLSIYIYPQNEIDNHLLRDEFLSYEYALNHNSSPGVDLKPSFGELSNEKTKVNYVYSIFSNSLEQPDFFKGVKYVDKQSLLAIYECGGWRFKIRVTSDDMTKDQLGELKQKVETYFDVLNVAAITPLPINDAPDIVLSPVIQRDSMMINATIVAAQSKIEWLKKNSDIKEISTGFNDMKIDSEVYAIEKMVEFYKLHKNDWKMTSETEKYFNEMTTIVDNNKTKDHIYEKFHSVIDYPEGESRKESYVQFKIDKDISENTNENFYKIFYKLE
ncbi:MAG: hypothetical protein K0R77_858 [Chryseobacterium sp.]|jgi:hypothetical protein|uniref:hypothetical protein n=1 Tax=Chryseobacterium sp. TaxID=1871047 RepID=UPI00261F2D69|nr:hypothetical protein [Chryseobacterium sp.]MDF2551583.1 hypothetical protein [Chryseobacterium sp.]